MSVHIQQARPPHVVFERRAEEDRQASIEQGRYVARDADYAIVTPAGSKDRVERLVSDWFSMLAGEVRSERWPQAWLDQLKAGYEAWKLGQTPPESGTPLATWPALSPAPVRNWQQLNVRTIEELAEVNEEAIAAYGMGGRDMRARAALYLENVKDVSGPLLAKLHAAEAANAALQVRLDSLEVQLSRLASDETKKLETPAPTTPTVKKL